MKETILITSVITIGFVTLFGAKIFNFRKKIKWINLKINQKKKDQMTVSTYDSISLNFAQFVNGKQCQRLTDNEQQWYDDQVKYLNSNITEYLDAKERLYGEYYVLTF